MNNLHKFLSAAHKAGSSALGTTKRRVTAVLIVLFIIIIASTYMAVIRPFAVKWVINKLPEMAAIQKDMAKQLPGKKVNTFDQTYYSIDSQPDGKLRSLTVTVVHKERLTLAEERKAREVICNALGDRYKQYDVIKLGIIHRKQVLPLFYSQSYTTQKVSCEPQKPSAPLQVPLPEGYEIPEEEPLVIENQPLQAQPSEYTGQQKIELAPSSNR